MKSRISIFLRWRRSTGARVSAASSCDWLTATALEAGVFRVNLEVRTRNEAARLFYQALGFDALNVVPGYYQGREAALRMTRRLGLAKHPPG